MPDFSGVTSMPSDTLAPFLDDSLSDIERAELAINPPPRVFAVVSWGCAGTTWLAKALNTHPDVFCVHAGNHFMHRFGKGPRLDGFQYLRTLGAQASAYKAAGDVHGVSRDQVGALRNRLGDLFGCGILIREPMPRLRSQIAHFKRFAYSGWGALEYIDTIAAAAGCNPRLLTVEQRYFFHAVNMLNAILSEVSIAPIYRMEDLSADADHLTACATQLTNGAIEFSTPWAETAITLGKINEHISKTKVAGFDDFERAIIKAVVKREAWDAYENLGYRTPDFIC